MSGRGRGRGGRGRGRGPYRGRFSNKPKKPKEDTKKTLKDYSYYVGSSKQASDFETTTEFVINHIKKTFTQGQDIAESLEELTMLDPDEWKPSLQASLATEEATIALETRQFEIEFKEATSRFLTRKQQYEENLYKAYALIWERCSQSMKNKIVNLSTFKSNIKNNPIELLKEIKRNALNYQEYKYDMAIMYDAISYLLRTKQNDFDSLQDYARKFKTSEASRLS